MKDCPRFLGKKDTYLSDFLMPMVVMLRLNPARLDTQACGSDLALYSRLKLKLKQEDDPKLSSKCNNSNNMKIKIK